MATISVTASQVRLISGPTAIGSVSAAVTAGQGVAYDPATGLWVLAQEDGTLTESGYYGFGVAVSSAPGASQQIIIALPGAIVNLGAGAALSRSSRSRRSVVGPSTTS